MAFLQNLLKRTKVVLVFIYTKLYCKCLKEECFTDDFKLYNVIPIPKTAARKELRDFRPISLLNILKNI